MPRVATRTVPGVFMLGGPTASGKTEFALALAERCGAEIVGADSRQVYADMPIGTAAPTPEERRRVPHHLIGFVDPYQRYSAARYVEDAAAAIAAIHARGRCAIVAGGTGFYLRALCGGVDLAAAPDPAIRERLQRETQMHSAEFLHAWLQVRDPARAAAVSARDPYRIVRALEVRLTAAIAAGAAAQDKRPGLPTFRKSGLRYIKMALRVEPAELAARIAQRTEAMLERGLVAEAERIGASAIAADAVGYREALAYATGCLTYAELRLTLTRATRRYAKRQLTWLRAEPELTWIEPTDIDTALRAVAELGW